MEEVTRVVEPIEHMLEQLNVNTVFGEPTKEGDVTVIPVAEISAGFGYGYGFGRAPSGEAESEGGGGGGGAGGRARPVGYIRITPDGVEFEPIMDQSRIALAGIAMGAWSVFWVTKTMRTCAQTCAKVFARKDK